MQERFDPAALREAVLLAAEHAQFIGANLWLTVRPGRPGGRKWGLMMKHDKPARPAYSITKDGVVTAHDDFPEVKGVEHA